MPLEVRKTLLAWLEREHPEIHYRLREGLHRLLAQNPPPEGSAAYDDYAMNLALNEWLYTRDSERKKELQRDIAARLAAGQQADFMVLRMLDPGRSLTPEQFEVPDDWKKHLQEKGFAFLNPRRAWWWAVPIWLVLCGLALWWQPENADCGGLSEMYKQREYCIENFEDWAIFREILVQDALLVGQKEAADSISSLMLAIGWSNHNLSGFNNSSMWMVANPRRFKTNDLLRYANKDTVVLTDAVLAFDNRVDAFNLIMEELSQRRVQYLDVDKEKPTLDSISFLQNAAVAYFNEGAKIYNTYSSMWETVENSRMKPRAAYSRSDACAYFSRAQEINALLPDTSQLWYVREAAKGCDQTPLPQMPNRPPPLQDITINGQLNNAETKRPLYLNEWTATKIEAKGLAPANFGRGAFFNIRVPGDRKTAIELNITSPGFEPLRMTIRPANFRKYLNVELVPFQKCYETASRTGYRPDE